MLFSLLLGVLAPPPGGEAWKKELDRLFRKHNAAIARFLLSLEVPEGAVQDGVQKVFFKAWKKGPYVPGPLGELGWLCAFAKDVAGKTKRTEKGWWKLVSNRTLDEKSVRKVAGPPSPAAVAEERELLSRLSQAIEELDTEHREIFALRHLEELTVAQIAQVTSVPENTVRSRLSRARDKILQRWPELGEAVGKKAAAESE